MTGIGEQLVALFILAIPLATSVTSIAQTILLCSLLVLRLQKRVKMDKGLERLKRMRTKKLKERPGVLTDEKESLEAGVAVENSIP